MIFSKNLPDETLLQMKDIVISEVSKAGGRINLELKKGEIHAIMGEASAGKTGIAHILAGLKKPEQGLINVKNQPIQLKRPSYAWSLGIGVLFQDIRSIPYMAVKEYLMLWDKKILVSSRKMIADTQTLLNEYDIAINPNSLLISLNQEELRLISLMKLLARKPTVVVLDEPASDLSELKKSHLFRILRKYIGNERGVLFLSGQLEEVLQVSDRITILKSGGTANSYSIDFAKKILRRFLIFILAAKT